MDDGSYFAQGEIVSWNGELYMVLKPFWGKDRKADLIPSDGNNITFGVSDTWPPDGPKFDTIRYVAEHVEDLFQKRIKKLLLGDI